MSGIEILVLAGVLHLVLLFAHGGYIALAHGVVWGTGRRDHTVAQTDLGRRFERTIANNMESLAAFLPVMTGGLLVGLPGNAVIVAAGVYLCARGIFAVLYLANIPYLRTAAWLCGQGAIALIAIKILRSLA